jgi:hypothetical protein
MPTRTLRKSHIIAGTVAAILVAGGGTGAAFAYWTSTGSGTGTATTGTSVAFTVTSQPATGGPLTPGGPAATVSFSVTNPGAGTETLSAVVVSVADSSGGSWTAVSGCSAADYTVSTPIITYGDIAAGGVVTGTVTVTMNNRSASQDACKDVAVPLYFVAS